MKQTTLIFIFAVFCAMARGQGPAATPTVLASSGQYYGTPGQLEVSYTIGEMTSVSTVGNVYGLHLTQGFHQPQELNNYPLAIIEPNVSPISFSLYPNPTINNVEISYEMPEQGKTITTITDILGRPLISDYQHYLGGKAIKSFDVSCFAGGSYMLTLQFFTNNGKQYFSTKQFSITK
jgi:hypothetical protein